ncbi:hypothetical protein Nepgr_029135 [Nepenthes gracilis]|uniref:Uncharacterized protein n=1 Tax=Nepenthes gracilis TaxID=150966 RepID=A0AAD3TDD4_NEPGR|nr:hypothetical protein Nepgr_029135 [Nepenthes gracilis]
MLGTSFSNPEVQDFSVGGLTQRKRKAEARIVGMGCRLGVEAELALEEYDAMLRSRASGTIVLARSVLVEPQHEPEEQTFELLVEMMELEPVLEPHTVPKEPAVGEPVEAVDLATELPKESAVEAIAVRVQEITISSPPPLEPRSHSRPMRLEHRVWQTIVSSLEEENARLKEENAKLREEADRAMRRIN